MCPRYSNFSEIVIDELAPVLHEHGLVPKSVAATSVAFGYGGALIEVRHDQRSYEIELYITWPRKSDRSFSLSEILGLYDHPLANNYRNYAATTLNSAEDGIKKMAVLLEELFGAGLRFDQDAYERLVFQGRKRSNAMEKKIKNSGFKNKAAIAWGKKDYSAVVLWLSSVVGDLSNSERQKLDYAKKKLDLDTTPK